MTGSPLGEGDGGVGLGAHPRQLSGSALIQAWSWQVIAPLPGVAAEGICQRVLSWNPPRRSPSPSSFQVERKWKPDLMSGP